MNNEERIKQGFYGLYCAFMSQVVRDNFDQSICIGLAPYPVIDFQGYTHSRLQQLTALPQYIEFSEVIEEELGQEVNPYFIFGHMFTEVYMGLNSINTQYSVPNNIPEISNFGGNIETLISAFETGEMDFDQRIENSYLVALQGIKVEKKIEIPNVGYIDSLGSDLDKIKNTRRYDFDWNHVYTGLYVRDDKNLCDDYIKVLLTILRLYKSGDVRFLHKYQEADNFATGRKYLSYKMTSSNLDYSEESAKHRGDALYLYELNANECDEFILFYEKMFTSFRKMKHSCEYFNRAILSPHYIKELFLFIVIESFFSDVTIEISYRVSLYVTKLLGEDQSFFLMFKELYSLRSKLAHGDPKGEKKIRDKLNKKYYDKVKKYSGQYGLIEGIVRALFINLGERNWNPENSALIMRNMLIE